MYKKALRIGLIISVLLLSAPSFPINDLKGTFGDNHFLFSNIGEPGGW